MPLTPAQLCPVFWVGMVDIGVHTTRNRYETRIVANKKEPQAKPRLGQIVISADVAQLELLTRAARVVGGMGRRPVRLSLLAETGLAGK
jgi:hypothetical protein